MANGFRIEFTDIKENLQGFISVTNQANTNLVVPLAKRLAPEGTRVSTRMRPRANRWAGARITDPGKDGLRREAKTGRIARALGGNR